MGNYHINYREINLKGHVYFIPEYAVNRPAAAVMLNGYRYELNTHKFVTDVLRETKMSMIHGGAFFGDMIPHFAEHCKGTLYAFEPVLENYVLSRRCTQENDITNVVLFNAAMSTETGYAYMQTRHQDGWHMGGSSQITEDNDKKTQLVNTMRIDDLKLKELSIIHLDLEGHEMPAIEGALETIKREEPIILIEASKGKDTSVIKNLGYEMLFESHLIDFWSTEKFKNIAVNAIFNMEAIRSPKKVAIK